jgi:hypothetical protein
VIRPIISTLTAGLVVVLITAAAAQTTAPMQQQHVGDHNASSQPVMESHHSFGDAEKWAKQFDDPQRAAWQKPDEVLDALQLQRTDKVADIGAGTAMSAFGSPSVCQTARCSQSTSNPTWCATSTSERGANI